MPEAPIETKKQNSALKILGIGCGVVLLVGLLALGFVVKNARDWVSTGARQAIVAVIEESELSPEQKAALTERAERLTDDFREKRITLEQLGRVGTRLAEGPVLNLALLTAIQGENVSRSTLSADERAAATLAFQRYARGVVEQRIPATDLERLMEPYRPESDGGRTEIRVDLSPEELDALVAEMSSAVETAGIPEGPYEVDFAALFDSVIAEVRGSEGAGPAGG